MLAAPGERARACRADPHDARTRARPCDTAAERGAVRLQRAGRGELRRACASSTPSGKRVDRGDVSHPDGKQASVERRRARRPGSRHLHRRPTASSRRMGIRSPAASRSASANPWRAARAAAPPTWPSSLARSDTGPVTEGAYGVVRGLHYAALLLVRRRACSSVPSSGPPRHRRVGPAACWRSRPRSGLSLRSPASRSRARSAPASPSSTRSTQRCSTARCRPARARRGCCAPARGSSPRAVLLLLPRPPRRADLALLALPAAVLVGSLPYAGHADTQTPKAVLIPADVLHVLAASAWLGGLVLLLAAFWPRRDEPARARGAGDGAVLAHGAAGHRRARGRRARPGVVLPRLRRRPVHHHLWHRPAGQGRAARRHRRTRGREPPPRRPSSRPAKHGTASGPTTGDARRGPARGSGPGRDRDAGARRAAGRRATRARSCASCDVGPMRLQMDIEPAKVGPERLPPLLLQPPHRRAGRRRSRSPSACASATRTSARSSSTSRARGPPTTSGSARRWACPASGRRRSTSASSKFDQFTARTKFNVR